MCRVARIEQARGSGRCGHMTQLNSCVKYEMHAGGGSKYRSLEIYRSVHFKIKYIQSYITLQLKCQNVEVVMVKLISNLALISPVYQPLF